jgi:two-component system CheB/CheR fusion protein
MDAQYISLSIRDFGVGIQKRHQQKIFTRFFRVRSKDLDTYPGLGLGLYITADIVKRHGGTISVKSSTGKGSTFTVTLPIKNMNI